MVEPTPIMSCSTSCSYFFPEEVWVKILSKLPHRSLFRFRSVSKSWLSLIGSPDFYSRNFLNDSLAINPSSPTPTTTTQKQNSSLLFFRRAVPTDLVTYNTLDDSTSVITRLNLEPYYIWQIRGSCNGLVCLTGGNRILLCNPATSALKELPKSDTVGCPVDFCFGFDANSNDFKVVRILCTRPYDPCRTNSVLLEECVAAEVYGLSSGCWRKLDVGHDVVPYYYMGSSSGSCNRAYVNGVCFAWKVVHRYTYADEIIVAFDMTQEVFKLIPLPDARVIGDLYYKEIDRNLTVLNESLALIVSPHHDQKKEKGFDIWVLFEFGVKESWTRLVTINPPFQGLQRTLGIWNNVNGGLLFILENTERQLVLYDPFTQTVRIIPVDRVEKPFQVFVYTPTQFPTVLCERFDNYSERCMGLSFKKRKTTGALVDDDLEDTASSLVNSPKVCDLNSEPNAE